MCGVEATEIYFLKHAELRIATKGRHQNITGSNVENHGKTASSGKLPTFYPGGHAFKSLQGDRLPR
jgi:hypothetical protein